MSEYRSSSSSFSFSSHSHSHSATSASLTLKTFNGTDFNLYHANVNNYFKSHNIHYVLTTDPGTPLSRLTMGGTTVVDQKQNEKQKEADENEEEEERDTIPYEIDPLPSSEKYKNESDVSRKARDERNERIEKQNIMIKRNNEGIQARKHKMTIIETTRSQAFTYIFASLSSDIAKLFLHIPGGNVYALWSAIQLKYKGVTLVNQSHIRDMMSMLFLGSNEDIDTFVAKITGYQIQLEELNAGMSTYDIIHLLYKGLPKSYDTVVDMIQHSTPDGVVLTFSQIVTKLREYQIKQRNKATVAQAHLAHGIAFNMSETVKIYNHNKTSAGAYSIVCFRCGVSGHGVYKCPVKKESVVCATCKETGHMTSHHAALEKVKEKRKKLRNDREKDEKSYFVSSTHSSSAVVQQEIGYKFSNKDSGMEYGNSVAAGQRVTSGLLGNRIYHLDSAASSHFTNYIGSLHNISTIGQINLKTASGSTLVADQSGINTIQNADGTGDRITFKNTIYVPDISANLISVGQLAVDGNIVVFNGNEAMVIKPDGKRKMVLPSGMKISFPKVGKLYSMEDIGGSEAGTTGSAHMIGSEKGGSIVGVVQENNNGIASSIGVVNGGIGGSIAGGGTSVLGNSVNKSNKDTGMEYGNSVAAGQHVASVEKGSLVRKLTDTQLLHAKMGHLSGTGMQKLLNNGGIGDIGMVKSGLKLDEIKNCDGCLRGKATRQSFNGVRVSKVKAILDCIHSDVCNPVKGKYFITFIDEFSRKVWVVMVDHKSEVEERIKEWIILQERQTGRKVKEFHSDNGGEYISNALKGWFKERGIYATTTVARTPERNGIPERMNRTLIERIRAMLIAAGMSGIFWWEALRMVVYIRNRCTTNGLVGNGISNIPEVVWCNGEKQSMKHIKVFGCNVIVHIDDVLRNGKLDEKGRQGVHLGWDEIKNGYYIYDTVSKKITTQHSVKFDENNFSFVKLMDLESLVSLDANQILYNGEDWDDIQFNNELELLQRISLEEVKVDANDGVIQGINNGIGGGIGGVIQGNNNGIGGVIGIANHGGVVGAGIGGIIGVANDIGVVDGSIDGVVNGGIGDALEESKVQHVVRPGGVTFSSGIDTNNIIVGKRNRGTASKYGMVSEGDIGCLVSIVENDSDVGYLISDSEIAEYSADDSSIVGNPNSYSEAMNGNDRVKWKDATNVEMSALDENGTWELVPLPVGRRALGVTWVFTIKHNSDGSIDKYKARLVVRGDQQREHIDYDPNNIYAPVVGIITLRIVLSIATILDYELFQMDVKAAFLNAPITEEVYVRQAQGYDDGTGRVCRLFKTLYGIRQAPYEWNKVVHTFMIECNWVVCISDPCLYFRLSLSGHIILFAIFVDDCAAAVSKFDVKEYNLFKALFMEKFKTTDLGNMEWILKIKLIRNREKRTLFLSQQLYVQKVVKMYGLSEAKIVSTPESNDIKLSKSLCPLDGSEEQNALKDNNYREMVGSLLYATATRFDISHIVNVLARYLNNPGYLHIQAAKNVIKYLKGTDDYGLLYTGYEEDGITVKSINISAYSDADWAGNVDNYKSTSAGILSVGENIVDGFTRSQHTVSLSSTESEFIAVVETSKGIKWAQSLLSEIGIPQILPIILYCDNKSTIAATLNKGMSSKLRHMNIRYHWIKDEVKKGDIKLVHVSTANQLADILTKTLTPKPFNLLRDRIVSKQQV